MAAQIIRMFIVAWGALEILLFGGLIFGWASLVYVFKREGYFGDLCGTDTVHTVTDMANNPDGQTSTERAGLKGGHYHALVPTLSTLLGGRDAHLEWYMSSDPSSLNMSSLIYDTMQNATHTKVSQYTSVYATLQFFGIFLAPLSGRLMDRRSKHGPETPSNPRLDKLEVCIASFLLDSTVGTLLAITLSIPMLKIQYLSFVLHVIHRACLYGPNSAFIAQAFPMEHFGKIFGLAMSFAAAFSMIQFPIFILIQGPLNGNPLLANLFTLVLMFISFGHPLYIHYWCQRARQQDLCRRDALYKSCVLVTPGDTSREEDTLMSTAMDM